MLKFALKKLFGDSIAEQVENLKYIIMINTRNS